MEASEYEGFFRTSYPLLVRYAQRRFEPETAERLAGAALSTIWTKNLVSPKDDEQWRLLHAFAYRVLDTHMKTASENESARNGEPDRVLSATEASLTHPDVTDEVWSRSWPDRAKPLPLTDRDVLELVLDGYRVAEIALILGCTTASVSLRLRRARKKSLLLWEREVDRERR